MKAHFLTMVSAAALASVGMAQTITQDFEGVTAPNLPSGWALVGTGGVTAANGNPGNSFDPASGSTNYLVNSGTGFDATQDFSGTFDFILREDNFYDNISFWIGDIQSGLTTAAGDHFRVDLKRTTFSRRAGIFDATGNADTDKLFNGDNNNNYAISANVQYNAEFSWTAATGTFSVGWATVGNLPDTTPMTISGFSFNSNEVFFGFGTIDATGSFDNISITGTAVPEPSTAFLFLGSLGALALLRRRR